MISEVVNALFLTYLLTEYLLVSNINIRSGDWAKRLLHRQNVLTAIGVGLLNLLERFSGLTRVANDLFQGFLHAPKIVFAAFLYVVALHQDCRRVDKDLRWKAFLAKVGYAFLYVLPVYPALAVLISFGFLFVINIFEFFHWDESILNWPIYYGTLYGPFSLVYWRVKQSVVEERTSLPTKGYVLGRG